MDAHWLTLLEKLFKFLLFAITCFKTLSRNFLILLFKFQSVLAWMVWKISEAVARRCSIKQMFWKFFENLQKKVSIGPCHFVKQRLQHRCFPGILKNIKKSWKRFLQNTSERLFLYFLYLLHLNGRIRSKRSDIYCEVINWIPFLNITQCSCKSLKGLAQLCISCRRCSMKKMFGTFFENLQKKVSVVTCRLIKQRRFPMNFEKNFSEQIFCRAPPQDYFYNFI